ncbi:Gfo/Idh/MocA family oxidoreductase [Pontibacter silvestris]|uniref:Gfo/Idh/MocA family oxidoreductase n=1 Tax=Pontibacter silvestris TaxID=2305183 RepID=A0ABW4X2F9_9BACT|nr:Gfo/Idh/MocA family oxidoreductase [Pontibacter silvestris]MCC9134852.1 Gfo/Idh/MocA family oxidoreductase [Pontibacter silvestris]
MDKKVVRAGIVGSGFAAKFHYEALQRIFSAKVKITGVYSPSPANLHA